MQTLNHKDYNRLLKCFRELTCTAIIISFSWSPLSYADHPDHPDDERDMFPLSEDSSSAQIVEYPMSFFSRYQPNTALDMVNQVPGFQLDNGANTRGFSTAAGNILINDNRPNVKQDSPSSILGRIPASSVIRIDLIRGQTSGVDLQGQPVVANIILREETEAAVRWEGFVWKSSESDIYMPGGSISLSDRWSNGNYNAGVDGNRHAHATKGSRNSFDGDGNLTEERAEDIINTHFLIGANLNASTTIGETLLQFSTEVGYDKIDETLTADRVPQAIGSTPLREQVVDARESNDFELGLTAERFISDDLLSKGILIYNQRNFDELSTQQLVESDTNTQTLFRVADIGTDRREAIARSEFDWTGIQNHTIQLNIEGAYNELDGSLVQTVDDGTGPVLEDVPGSNTKVKEFRGDFVLADTWEFGQVEFNYGIGAEVSNLKQTGDAELKRDFFFVKPHAVMIYSPERSNQTRVRVAREVSQLDFNDFVSASVFQDNDRALGNPNLRPETTWVTDVTHERRFGDISVIKLRAYHNWISDVEDLLPLSTTDEAPGNIGNGRRWGLELESTIPMDWLGLKTSRLDVKGRWQDSSVTDPVTGDKRVLSSQGRISSRIPYNDIDVKYITVINFRQDFEPQRVAWGWEIIERAKRPLFKVNELDVFNEGIIMAPFIETTRWMGVKMKFAISDLLDETKSRVRTIYEGERGNSLIRRNEITNVTRGRQFEFIVSGSF
jgi:hypothetical protein